MLSEGTGMCSLRLWVSLLDSLPVEFLIWGFVLLLLVVPIVFPGWMERLWV
jgi:hypothetical protein